MRVEEETEKCRKRCRNWWLTGGYGELEIEEGKDWWIRRRGRRRNEKRKREGHVSLHLCLALLLCCF